MEAAAPLSLLRFITCGSVDDGKSTLIGRLLHDARAVPADELEALARASSRSGATGNALDFSLLVDGLSAEREQGITIDVAYRYFATAARSFIVADTPGHEQYTRNMVTGASTADLAVILVDVRRGVTAQTRRHSRIVRLLGIRHVVLAVNKMDLVDQTRAAFDAVVADYAAFARTAGIEEVVAIPVSGLTGANIVAPGAAMPWYDGPTLLAHLETVRIDPPARRSFRMPVQWVNRPAPDLRGLAGTITAGEIAVGDAVRVVPAGRVTRLARILAPDGERARARAGEAVTLVLADAIDCARGDVIAGVEDPPEVADAFNATLIWMDAVPLAPGRAYLLKLATQTVAATVRVRARVDIADGTPRPAAGLGLNDIGLVEVVTATPLVFERFADSAALGGFILIDRETNATVAGGLIEDPVRRASNIHWQQVDVTREARARQKGQHPRILWFTGLSGSGKSTLANLVERALHAEGRHSFLLDGDNVRHGLNRDLGFSAADRAENIRRVGEVARLMADAGLIVLVAFISPFAAERDRVRATVPAGEFIEIFVDAPLGVAEARDPKGLYAKARAGLIPDFTGISSPYEPPVAPDIHIDAANEAPEDAARRIVAYVLALDTPASD